MTPKELIHECYSSNIHESKKSENNPNTQCSLPDERLNEMWYVHTMGFPGGSVVKNPPATAGDTGDLGSIPGSGRSSEGENGNPLQYSLPGRSHGLRSLAGYRPWGCKSQTQLSSWAHTGSYNILYVHILSYDLVIQRNAILIHATAWMNLVKEISHKAPHTVCFHWYEIFRLGNSTGTESRLVVS